MKKIIKYFKNYLLIKKYPFLQTRNVWTNEENKRYDCTWLDDMPKGWRKRFGVNLCEDLKQLFEESKVENFINKYKILQIKEKYGSLRWYDCGVPKDIYKKYDNIINKYQKISEHTCIICGKNGSINYEDYWLEPLCEAHRKKEKIRIFSNNEIKS